MNPSIDDGENGSCIQSFTAYENEYNVEDCQLNTQSNDSKQSARMPDQDSMKMFVGQIPKDWSEDECRQLLEPYGEIFSVNILKDKETKKSKGCCFVTYYTRKAALDAQNALHNLKKLPSCGNPIQMKPADNENKNDRKLFVGKLPKFIKEQDVEKTFSIYGNVEECIVIRDNNGHSKGCAFVTFSSRSSASAAIRALNQTKTLEGCTSPIVVKFADSNKKELKKPISETIPGNLNSLYAAPQMQSFVRNAAVDNSYLSLFKAQQQQLMSLTFPQSYIPPDHLPYQNILFAGTKLPLLSNQLISSPSPQLNSGKFLATDQLPITTLPTFAALQHGYSTLTPLSNKFSTATSAITKQAEGPEGANLFIYHLPAEYSDSDLIKLFTPFGTVISAKVFIDKNSNMSKCFGFVSYDNVDSAQQAIRSMNGFQVLNKRLKVQPKKVRDKPY